MKKPKSKLEKAKERFITEWAQVFFGRYTSEKVYQKIRRQLNNLIRLAKEEEREKAK